MINNSMSSSPDHLPSTRRITLSHSRSLRSLLYDSDSGSELRRHPDLWFKDGSVVCRAENVLFRVHMSQLSRHSECFRDMFDIASAPPMEQPSGVPSGSGSPQHPDSEDLEVLENCPVIFLQDKADDVASLFTALYDGPSVTFWLNFTA
jgi:hypothetical protein